MKEERGSGDRERIMRASLGKEKGEIIKKRKDNGEIRCTDRISYIER